MVRRIPVRLVRIGSVTEVSMDLDDFETSDVSVGDDTRLLKDEYHAIITDVRPVLAGIRKPSTTERWRACRRMVDFVDNHAKFYITNFPAACSKDIGLSERNLQRMMSFGRGFDEASVRDSVPYNRYLALLRDVRKQRRLGTVVSEAARLIADSG